MDALALLCNLYGDGPSTLKRLRAHGVKRIQDLGGRQAGELATLLSLPTATARRFLKEASALEKRVLDSNDDAREAQPKPPVAKRAPREAARGKDAMLAAAARRWDELDRSSPLFAETGTAAAASTALEGARGIPLAAAELDRATHDALDAIGILTLEELATLDSDVLATAAGLGLSQVLFVQSLARRKAREHGELELHAGPAIATEEFPIYELQPGAHSDPRFSPTERPPGEWLSVGAGKTKSPQDPAPDEGAGPFA